MAVATCDGRGLEDRVVDRFFGRFDDGLEERRHGVVADRLRISQIRARSNVVLRAEGDDVIAAAVGRRRAGASKPQHRARRQPFQIPRVHRRVGRHNHNDRTVRHIAGLISTASGSERVSRYRPAPGDSLATARGTDQAGDVADGSIIMVVATDAPMDARNLKRLAARAMLGLARTGSPSTNGSGDYVIAFSTQNHIRAGADLRNTQTVGNDAMSPLFEAVVEATEEAIYNSIFKATTVTGRDGHRVEALPIEKTVEILRKYGAAK